MTIVVVDDEISALTTFLVNVVNETKVDYKFFQNNPKECLSYVETNKVVGAFLDINMPEMNGLDLAEALLKITPAMKIVFITGCAFDVESIEKTFGEHLLGFAYKPFDTDVLNRYIDLIYSASFKPAIVYHCFGHFDFFVNGRPLEFYSSKSKELLALLVVYQGANVSMDDALCHLWPDKTTDLAKRLYRDAVWKLRKLLSENGLLFLVNFRRAHLALLPDYGQCDYWDYLAGKNRDYHGEFLLNYDWSFDYQNRLDVQSGL